MKTKIDISLLIENQLPAFIRDEYPTFVEFLTEYYRAIESKGNPIDIIRNIDSYVRLENLTNLPSSTTLTSDLVSYDDTILVTSTEGFPDTYGLVQIDSEVILYRSKTSTSFLNCSRGFSGTTGYVNGELVFSDTVADNHLSGVDVINLNQILLENFLLKLKKQIFPGFENKELYQDVNQRLFISRSNDFYSAKGTVSAFEILFKALYGEEISIITPKDYLFKPSDAQYRITKDIIVEQISGNALDLEGRTLFQDQTSISNKSYGAITRVEPITRNNATYYRLSLDYDYKKDINLVGGTVFGEFSITPRAYSLKEIQYNDNYIDVDSTIGFPNSGELVVNTGIVTYSDKNIAQFLNCTGITTYYPIKTEVKLNEYAYADEGAIKVRIIATISDADTLENSYLYQPGDKTKILTYGYNFQGPDYNNWIFNISPSIDAKITNITILTGGLRRYEVETIDDNTFYINDNIELEYIDGNNIRQIGIFSIKNIIIPKKKFQFDSTNDIVEVLNVNKIISKFNDTPYNANVQNVYGDITQTDNLYVCSNSLPKYLTYPSDNLEIDYQVKTLTGNYGNIEVDTLVIENHGFLTGEEVVYFPGSGSNNIGITTNSYFVKRITENKLKLAKSRENIYKSVYVGINSTSYLTGTDNKLLPARYVKNLSQIKNLTQQALIRNIAPIVSTETKDITDPGYIGLLINGVEILNYKSEDSIFYGQLNDIKVAASTEDFDVLNPPTIQITDLDSNNNPIGIGASAYCNVQGSLARIDILNPGFNYDTEPKIEIVGGNGYGASAKANLIPYTYEISFPSSLVNTLQNRIGFGTYHNFSNGEKVTYNNNGNTSIAGLNSNSNYYISVFSSTEVKLHKNFEDAISSINEIQLTSVGYGVQRLISTNKKKKIGSIKITNSGYGYTKGISVASPSDIDIERNIITIKNNIYSTGEKIKYSYSGTSISGLSTTTSYYVTKIDGDSIALSYVGTVEQGEDFYIKNKQYVSLGSIGSGTHTFSYEPITVTVVTTSQTNQVVTASINPIFRGKIKNVVVTSKGSGYGDQEIINYSRQPKFEVTKGSGALVDIVISGTTIQKVIIINPGVNYESSPTLTILGDGNGALLTPVVSNGKLIEVKVINGGLGYTKEKTKINVSSAGTKAVLVANIQKWTINLFNRYLNYNPTRIKLHDGIIENSLNPNYELEYSHLYSPRQLREIVYSSSYDDSSVKLIADIENDDGTPSTHSPILGWSYDGCPIYGPYGIDSTGKIKQYISGYDIPQSIDSNRPSIQIYGSGFFVEDYIYTADANKIDDSSKYEYLDENNGRYCITPEYPNGVYAYFTSLEKDIESNPNNPFNGYKKPKFPYFIGNYYKFKKNSFNLDKNSTQNNFDFVSNQILRNTTPYNLTSENSKYDFIPNPDKINSELSKVKSTESGVVNGVQVNYGGENYKVKDKIIFGDVETESTSYSAYVQSISGVGINTISSLSYSISNVEFYPQLEKNTNFIGISTIPHELVDNDYINIIGIGSDNINFNVESNIKVTSEKYSLSLAVGNPAATGIVTYFNVYGDLKFPQIMENDIFEVDTEQVKILSVDKKNSRVLVQREYNNTTGSSHQYSSTLNEVPRKFKFTYNDEVDRIVDFNRELYFNPSESVGIGTSAFSNTIIISNPGAGETSVIVPTGAIYLENHKLKTGQKVLYSYNIGTSISFYNSSNNYFTLTNNSQVFVAALNDNLIGISTIPVGVGSTGTIIGIGTTKYPLLYFSSVGSGVTHSFKTTYNSISGNVYKNIVTANTNDLHNLQIDDEIDVNCVSGITTSYKIVYNSNRKRLTVFYTSFLSSDLNITDNTIQINGHKLKSNDKIILTLTGSATGLQNNGIYYVIPIDKNKISLSSTYYNSNIPPSIVDFSGTSNGSIYLINPELTVYKNSILSFDLSDTSLSYYDGNSDDSAFEFKVYTNSNLVEEVLPSSIVRIGKIGIDVNASVRVNYNSTQTELYYNLIPVSNTALPISQKDMVTDDYFVLNNNKISLQNSIYSGHHKITGITSYTFTYNTNIPTEKTQYTSVNSSITYSTTSNSAIGGIDKIKIIHPEKLYKTLPFISSITSNNGKNAILSTYTNKIGKIKSIELNSVLFNYSSDNTIRPFVKFPEILKIDPLSKLKSVTVDSSGKNYTIAPDLIVIDTYDNKVVDCQLKYTLDVGEVQIIRNANTIHDSTPKIIPINNSNGVGISSISYNSTTKEVTVSLNAEFSQVEDFPFQIGSNVFVENIQVLSGNNYNSSDFSYNFFPVVGIDINPGGGGSTVVYSLAEYNLNSLGVADIENSSGKLVPQDQMVTFTTILEKNNFAPGETVYVDSDNTVTGTVQRWDNKNKLVAVITVDNFEIGSKLIGKTTGTQGTIVSNINFNCTYNISPSSIVNSGWQRYTGFLNEDTQRLHNNNYYQYFSYSIKSKVPYQTWNDSVSSLAHISGFKKFSDLVVESKDDANIGISTSQNMASVDIIQNLDSVIDIENVIDFDLGYENIKNIGLKYFSDEITFNSSLLQDYTESFGNVVLNLDDISTSFSSIDDVTKLTEFELTYQAYPIFEKVFDGSDTQIVDIVEDSIYIPRHFFRTGEKINYISNLSDINNTQDSIGIGTTLVGIALTDKLPLTAYVYKVDDNNIKLCPTALDSNSTPVNSFDIINVGIGTTHYIRATSQNSRCLISIDNVIQSPIVGTAISTTLLQNISALDDVIIFNNPLNFYSGDLIKIDDEILKVDAVGVGTTNYVKVIRSSMGSGISTHSSGSMIRKLKGNYNIVGNKINFSSAPYGALKTQNEFIEDGTGVITEEIKKSTFQGRVYLRSSAENSSSDTYSKNYIYDDISQDFDAINKNYNLTYNGASLTNLQYETPIVLLNNILQGPAKDYNLVEIGANTQLQFTGTATSTLYDPNTASVPRGGIILSVGSTSGYGYQPLVSAGGTAIIGAGGTISSISIGNSGSGYRSGIQTAIYVGIQTYSDDIPHITIVGYSTVVKGSVGPVKITNPGAGFTNNPSPMVVFDAPLSYTNIPLQYKQGTSGIGSQATIDIVVGQGSSVIDFNIKYFGYRYEVGDVLTIPYGGAVGIPTNSTLSFKPFEITVNTIYNDNFSAWSVGSFDVLDNISSLFNGKRRRFPLKINGSLISYITKPGSPVDLNSNIHVYINNVLQIPGESYVFNGGSSILFKEAPRGPEQYSPNTGDTAKILFYRGTESVDIVSVDVLDTVKPGDKLKLTSTINEFNENERGAIDIITPNSVETTIYNIPSEIVDTLTETEYYRTINWKRQREDLYIDGNQVNKNRAVYEPTITPTTNIIQSVGIGSTLIFVESVKGSFDNYRENVSDSYRNSFQIISQSDTPIKSQTVRNATYSGDHGIVCGIQSTTYGGNPAFIFDLFIPMNSILRDNISMNNNAITVSQIQQNNYFKLYDTRIGYGVSTLNQSNNVIGIGTTFIDNIYQVSSVSIGQTLVPGIGLTDVAKVTTKINNYNGITTSNFGYNSYYGKFSWGVISVPPGYITKQFVINNTNGVVGLNSTPIVRRVNPLKFDSYTIT